jgi:hypothetical protein
LRREQLKQDLYLVLAILLIVSFTSLIVAVKVIILTTQAWAVAGGLIWAFELHKIHAQIHL